MDDKERADIIMALDEPREMKQQGRYVKNFDQKVWDKCCQDVVERGNMEKVSCAVLPLLKILIDKISTEFTYWCFISFIINSMLRLKWTVVEGTK